MLLCLLLSVCVWWVLLRLILNSVGHFKLLCLVCFLDLCSCVVITDWFDSVYGWVLVFTCGLRVLFA